MCWFQRSGAVSESIMSEISSFSLPVRPCPCLRTRFKVSSQPLEAGFCILSLHGILLHKTQGSGHSFLHALPPANLLQMLLSKVTPDQGGGSLYARQAYIPCPVRYRNYNKRFLPPNIFQPWKYEDEMSDCTRCLSFTTVQVLTSEGALVTVGIVTLIKWLVFGHCA